jgi:hypothetical protein
MHEKVNLRQKLDLFDVHWQPKIVGRFNDNDLRATLGPFLGVVEERGVRL